MRRVIGIVLFLVAVSLLPTAGCARADARLVDFKGVSYTVYTVDLSVSQLRLIWRDGDTGRFRNARGIARWAEEHGQELVFATNAGMFEPDYSPCGVLISDGRQIGRLNLRDAAGNFYLKPNGVFMRGPDGARILDARSFRYDPALALATQSGPLLVLNGAVHPRFIPDSDSRLVRSGVGVQTPSSVVFTISNGPVNFYDFALLFRDRLQCPNALFLDGTISKMYLPALGRLEDDGNFSALFAVFKPSRSGTRSPR